ncbi:hypothetical protein NHX12_001006 [Muraenolepis orangiensis]|uniref:Ig-like domain-containing protein n=1 Tax=Muraenolepis orangiensis TaxID=630683 RepID=A0A9Q0E1M6_9TELE|nr:hypothetical protein NHX12_001006 [Muraenolepis orangiensis]
MIETPVNGLVKKQGEMVTLKCFAYGFPAPQFTWKPSGKEDGKVVSSLTLEASAEVMKEGVTCEVSNELGKDSKMFSVSIQGLFKGKLPCGKKTAKELSTGEVNNDIVVEMKTEKSNEEAGLLNKRPAAEQPSYQYHNNKGGKRGESQAARGGAASSAHVSRGGPTLIPENQRPARRSVPLSAAPLGN